VSGFGAILEDLNRSGVRYVLIGGIAMIRHGVVRATRDVDAVFDPDPANVERIRLLVKRWGATRPDGSRLPANGIAADRTIHLATPHGDLDLLSERVAAVAFADLLARAEMRRVDGVEAPICSLADLVALKRVAGRERDLLDLADLEAAHGELPDSPDVSGR
jgi:predicted nucleotidyltransferase